MDAGRIVLLTGKQDFNVGLIWRQSSGHLNNVSFEGLHEP